MLGRHATSEISDVNFVFYTIRNPENSMWNFQHYFVFCATGDAENMKIMINILCLIFGFFLCCFPFNVLPLTKNTGITRGMPFSLTFCLECRVRAEKHVFVHPLCVNNKWLQIIFSEILSRSSREEWRVMLSAITTTRQVVPSHRQNRHASQIVEISSPN